MAASARVQERVEALRELGKKADRARVQVPVTVGGVDRAWQTRLKRQVEDAAHRAGRGSWSACPDFGD